jgi:hypothetical protein
MVLRFQVSSVHIQESINQTLNFSNKSIYEICHTPHTFSDLDDFFVCYSMMAKEEPAKVVFELLLAASVVFLNSLVVICMIFGSNKKTCFDKILFGYCLVDGITGLFDIPLYHFRDVFGYWP